MTDIEYQIIDELYFVTQYNDLKGKINLPEEELKKEICNLLEKRWVKAIENDFITEVEYDSLNFEDNINTYCYLATKKGLLTHNSI